jgi:hypothetical protein
LGRPTVPSATWRRAERHTSSCQPAGSFQPLQQEAVGILGVNLIYAVFFQLETKESFFQIVAQDLEKRVEIDYVEIRGAAFEGWDQRAILAHLVCTGLAEAVCFPCSGPPVPPIDVLHRKATVLAPGSFEHVDADHAAIHNQLLASGIERLRGELAEKDPAPIGFFCFSVTPISEANPDPEISGLLERIDALHAHGGDVLLFRERELYGMTALVNRYTKEPIRFVVGLSLLVRIWEYRYNHLPGSFLEALSRLLTQNVRIYAHPMSSKDLRQAVESIASNDWRWTETNGWVSARELHPPSPFGYLYDYVLASNFLIPLEVPETPKTHE